MDKNSSVQSTDISYMGPDRMPEWLMPNAPTKPLKEWGAFLSS